ncbi:MAG: hypothetical protein MK009_08490 [Gammaproteobacteria bacterium]|nr:hypothetical protein [Gammaproteobacteria bacterium]|tara:strand:+ start:36 stop:731 length:696 start_codon:yes stop_codon:yes gene_type:complete
MNTAKLFLLVTVFLGILGGCGVTTRMEPYKQSDVVVGENESIVVLARKHHSSHEAEQRIVDCISDRLASGDDGLNVYNNIAFEDELYPWFEPSMAPVTTVELSELLTRENVLNQVLSTGVRFVVWLDGSTTRVASGGGISCAAGVGGAGCLGLGWWEDDSIYDATVWDLQELSSAGTIYADVSGRSVMPALVIPIPLIARPQLAACRGLTQQLRQFLTSPGYGNGPITSSE